MKIGNIAKEEQKICSIKQGGQVSLIEKGVSQVDIWLKSLPTQGKSVSKALRLEHILKFEEQWGGQCGKKKISKQ